MSQQGVHFSKKSVKQKHFSYLTFTDVYMDRQKLGTILVNKVVQKLELSKYDKNKKHAPKLIFFNDKKNQKDSDNF